MTEQREIRIEARLRNNILWHGIFDVFSSVAQFCRKYDFDRREVGELLNLKKSPLNQKGHYRNLCKRIAEVVGIGVKELFPLHLYAIEKTMAAVELSFAELPEGELREAFMLPSPSEEDPFEQAVQWDFKDRIEKLLSSLRPREAAVIKLRFGFEGGKVYTLEEIGRVLGGTRQRIKVDCFVKTANWNNYGETKCWFCVVIGSTFLLFSNLF